MRLATEHLVLQADPGTTLEIPVDVVNTSDLIDGVTARLIGLPDAETRIEPQLLPLFPGAEGRLVMHVDVPRSLTAGSHPVTVEVVSHGSGAPTQHLDLDLSVAAHPALRLHRTPQLIRARRSGRFLLDVENTGNTALDVTLASSLEDGRSTARFSSERFTVDPGTRTPVILVVKGPRMITGAEIDRTAAINLTASRAHSIAAMEETEQDPDLVADTRVVLKQRPTLSRGLLTALILMGIIAVWAAIFVLGLAQVLGGDPVTKKVATSFYPADRVENVAATAPEGALDKDDGLVDPEIGGTIQGVVTAASNLQPVPRILVKAWRDGRDGPVLVSSAATQADGSYRLVGLFPTSYKLQFVAQGYEPTWWGDRGPVARGRATAVPVPAQGEAEGLQNVVVTGLDASITGVVDQGASLTTLPTTVVARSLDIPDAPTVRTTTDGRGTYRLLGLLAPSRYELSFTTEGYEVKTLTTSVAGGEQRLQPSVVPASAEGRITGRVELPDGTPAGGVTVTTTVDGETVAVVTPTVGAVGSFTLEHLPTPATYVLTFTSETYGTDTTIVDLDAGASEDGLVVQVEAGTTSVTGYLRGPDGNGLGGATVTVGGVAATEDGTTTPTTTTLTSGDVGRFSLSGLAAPGDYTLTFTLEGYAPRSVPVSLDGVSPPPEVEVQLNNKLGGIAGQVYGATDNPYVGAQVTITNGLTTWTATSGGTGSIDGNGGYRVEGLPSGTYSVTVTAEGLRQQTAMVVVMEGLTSFQDLALGSGGG
ncbi:carboxypeptidase-like regulatory domain-containing protein [Nocardioides sp. 1609]|uniref:carboxypeptidase-like regulatory domain-containing protein n=1 Tax=Nocardioides sp. 1609 TaxID=2508327 RepID=UPI00106FCAA1|nr:carboxypeptidase-like regulatory domain-containing protein [Nocardioides sp. 1609]